MPSHHPLSHTPVMEAEVVAMLDPARGGRFVDCTVGTGGHARALLTAGADRVLGIDRDAEVLPQAGAALAPWADRVELVHADYRQVDVVLDGRQITTVDGMLADLGVSSVQLEASARGFSFNRDEPLAMRMDRSAGATAAELLREASERTIADRIFEYGEERHARRIARAIVETRGHEPVASTG
ncbi:MAG: 16S rRNA (cytosine(1402)-N(4))-methyltransferase RsmH, partial [Acidobacteria bacterium]|nr:16S rRNA (cytosine(1402)-N(4))-methyltransferase RsmH [Acidobacteriota bacterium]